MYEDFVGALFSGCSEYTAVVIVGFRVGGLSGMYFVGDWCIGSRGLFGDYGACFDE